MCPAPGEVWQDWKEVGSEGRALLPSIVSPTWSLSHLPVGLVTTPLLPPILGVVSVLVLLVLYCALWGPYPTHIFVNIPFIQITSICPIFT